MQWRPLDFSDQSVDQEGIKLFQTPTSVLWKGSDHHGLNMDRRVSPMGLSVGKSGPKPMIRRDLSGTSNTGQIMAP
ncbi:hypothetical protein NPIL_276371 [Nephila pilipes]|uniref:Uncharacterized protein n=1 Tax=Nephila pilipes TaxID=299642 RepID=A0A8X6MP69_NEPPI|nr:hypothetical protein NPIL_276371 [Nephila pilipes]